VNLLFIDLIVTGKIAVKSYPLVACDVIAAMLVVVNKMFLFNQGRIQKSKKGWAGKIRPSERKPFETVCKYNLLIYCFLLKGGAAALSNQP
jgi:hypothetical protein